MGILKFTFVKLMFKCFFVVCFILLFTISGFGTWGQNSNNQNFAHDNYIELTSLTLTNNFTKQNHSFLALNSLFQNQKNYNEEIAEDNSETINQNNHSLKGNTGDEPKKSILHLFLSDDEILKLRDRTTDFGINNVPAKLRSIYFAVVEKSFEYPIILVLIALVVFFIVNIFGLFIVLNNTIKRKNFKERFIKIYSKMYEEVLLAYMFGSIDWETAKFKLKKHNRKENRKILIDVLMNFNSNFKGELEHFIPEIYTRLSLNNDSIKMANSYAIHKKVIGIIELIHLYPEGAKDIVQRLINDPNDYVRAEAQTAYVRLNPETPFNFFYNLEKPFTRWTQLSVFNLIRIHSLPVPSFGQFLNFKHINIRNFSLRMITFFQQLESAEEVIKMVDNNYEQTRFLAYKAINDLRLYDSHDLIKNKYEKETPKNKVEIIRALMNIGINEDFDFLVEIMKTESMTLKTEACRAMYFMSSESKKKLLQMDKEIVPEIELLISHVTDPRN